jgi:4-alpha-glucanotransferase
MPSPTAGTTELPSPALAELARAHGVSTEYWTFAGEHRPVSAATIVDVLAALGVSAGTAGDVARAAEEVSELPWRRVLPPVIVCREGWTPWVPVHVTPGALPHVWLTLEDGSRRDLSQASNPVPPRLIGGVWTDEQTYELPGDVPIGWHTASVDVDGSTTTVSLVVTPAQVGLPEQLRSQRAWGLMDQMYAVRSGRSWGIGDLGDLADLAAWSAGETGADFVLINPLHAAEPVPPMEPSPYLPTTRRFLNPVYLRVEDIPEVGYLRAADRAALESHADAGRALNDADRIDRDAAWRAKLPALRLLFDQPRSPRRQRAYAAFCSREGSGLEDFATWCALVERHSSQSQQWPDGLTSPTDTAVAAARTELAHEIDFWRWLQWLMDEQMAAVQRDALVSGMSIGVVHDLAVGVHPGGADAWGLGAALASGVTVGAPPDPYNQLGQDWSQPPWRPDQLAEQGYAPYREMLRTVLRHAGGVRVDHIIGLFRLWWVPLGRKPVEGTYVRYDHEALIGILALEAHRAGALVIGEDLGNVEPWVRDYLTERGILGTSILWFERDEQGRPRPPEAYRAMCLASVTTHDLAPTAGYIEGEHIDVRAALGLFERPVEQERAEAEADREQMYAVLRDRGLLRPGAGPQEVIEALHRYLSWTPAKLLGVSVSDLAGDKRVINQPGTDDQYPNWRLPLAGPDRSPMALEELLDSRWARRLAGCMSGR